MSGCARVLDRLSDGKWHTSYELTHELDVMCHSRVADLRKRGNVIESRAVPDAKGLRGHEYRLLTAGPMVPLGEGAGARDGNSPSLVGPVPLLARVSSEVPSSIDGTDADALSDPTVPCPGQLDIFDVVAA